jgi:hypothetical protein
MKLMNKKGQGSFLSGDIPSILMIVISIGFFISSIYLSLDQFESRKADLNVEAALVDAASAFLKENAKIKPTDLDAGSEFWDLRINKIKRSYGVEIYVEVVSLDSSAGVCPPSSKPGVEPAECSSGERPEDINEVLSKRFPIALQSGDTALKVYPALVKVEVYKL